MQLLDVAVAEQGGWRVVTARGQVDVATAPQLRQVLQEQQYEPARRLVLELSGVEFLDSFGLGVLVGGLRRARTSGGRLVLAGASSRITRVLEVTGLDGVFELADTVTEVVAEDPVG